jgi:hypothetical protein
MKHLILISALLIGITFNGMTQNGGQFPENGSVKLEYTGSGKVKVYNKQACEAVIKVNDGMTEANLTIPGNANVLYTISSGLTTNFTVKAKTTTNCGGTDFGNVEIFIASLPLTFTGNPIVTYDSKADKVFIKLSVSDVTNVKHIKLRVSFDGGRTKKQMGLVFLDFSNPNATYTYSISRTALLKLNTQTSN